MKVSISLNKLDNMLNVLLVMQVITMLKTVAWALFIMTTTVASSTPFGGVIFRSLLQGIITIYLINKMKNSLSAITAWLVFISCLGVGFASLGSVVSQHMIFFNYGLFEIILVICAMVFMIRYYNYKSAVSRESKQ